MKMICHLETQRKILYNCYQCCDWSSNYSDMFVCLYVCISWVDFCAGPLTHSPNSTSNQWHIFIQFHDNWMLYIGDTILKMKIWEAREAKFSLPSVAQLGNGSGRIWTYTLKCPFYYTSFYGQARSHPHFICLSSMLRWASWLEGNSMEAVTVEKCWPDPRLSPP